MVLERRNRNTAAVSPAEGNGGWTEKKPTLLIPAEQYPKGGLQHAKAKGDRTISQRRHGEKGGPSAEGTT